MAARKSSRVHPNFKTKYRVTNRKDYEAGLRRRGDLTVCAALKPSRPGRPNPTEGRRTTPVL